MEIEQLLNENAPETAPRVPYEKPVVLRQQKLAEVTGEPSGSNAF